MNKTLQSLRVLLVLVLVHVPLLASLLVTALYTSKSQADHYVCMGNQMMRSEIRE